VLAYLAYATALALAGCGLWVIGEREYQLRLEQLEHRLGDTADNVAKLVGNASGHVDLIRRQAEALLEEPAPTFGARRAFAALTPSEYFAGFALDHLPPNSSPDQLINLTGSGRVPPIQSGVGHEMLMGLSLGAVLQATHAQIPEAAWIYYTSANRFVVMAPWAPSRNFHWREALLDYDFFKDGTPQRNPHRLPFWTDVYLDAAGKGLMSTAGRPVYDKSNRFRGTVNLDLTLATIDGYLADADFGHGRALLVNAQNHLIGDSAGLRQDVVVDLVDVLPLRGLDEAELTAHDNPDTFHRHGNWIFYVSPVAGAPWRFLLVVDRQELILEVLRSLWIGFVGLALLIVAIFAVEQRRVASVALAGTVATLQRMTMTLASARDEAQQANAAKSMLLANVSHELRTPLNAIIGFSDAMRHKIFGPLGNARYDEYAEDIQRSGQLLLSLINDLLDVTKLDAGRYELTESQCDLGVLAREATGLVKIQAERGGVTLSVSTDDGLPRLFADERALRQVILNLLSNAVKFTPSGGSVRIACGLNPFGEPSIEVRDTGRGIPEDEIQNLFQPFARTAEAKRASTPGTGLGLAIVKSLVELHQGRVALESRVGFGTTVTVTLPAERLIATETRGAA
jgi:two-component system cell cycle sensor histidine kinase PleC